MKVKVKAKVIKQLRTKNHIWLNINWFPLAALKLEREINKDLLHLIDIHIIRDTMLSCKPTKSET